MLHDAPLPSLLKIILFHQLSIVHILSSKLKQSMEEDAGEEI